MYRFRQCQEQSAGPSRNMPVPNPGTRRSRLELRKIGVPSRPGLRVGMDWRPATFSRLDAARGNTARGRQHRVWECEVRAGVGAASRQMLPSRGSRESRRITLQMTDDCGLAPRRHHPPPSAGPRAIIQDCRNVIGGIPPPGPPAPRIPTHPGRAARRRGGAEGPRFRGRPR